MSTLDSLGLRCRYFRHLICQCFFETIKCQMSKICKKPELCFSERMFSKFNTVQRFSFTALGHWKLAIIRLLLLPSFGCKPLEYIWSCFLYVTFLLYLTGTAPETPSGSTSTTKSGGSSGMQAADSGHPDSPDVPEVVDTVVGLVGPPPIDTHLGGPPHEGGPPNGLDPLGPLPPNWEKAYTDKGESYFIGKSLISIWSRFFIFFIWWEINLKNWSFV